MCTTTNAIHSEKGSRSTTQGHVGPPLTGEGEHETQVSVVQLELAPDFNGDSNSETIEDLLTQPPKTLAQSSFAEEQRKDPEVAEIITFLETEELPQETKRARRIALQKSLFVLKDRVLFYSDPKQEHRLRIVVPTHLQEQVLSEHHNGLTGGHFAVKKMYGALTRRWWWDGMYHDTVQFVSSAHSVLLLLVEVASTDPHSIPYL